MINVKIAVVSVCTDLTDPNGKSYPIGAFAAGRCEKDTVYALVMLNAPPYLRESVDVGALAFLEKLPRLVKRQARDAIHRVGKDPDLDHLMDSLCSSMRSSVHVSSVESVEIATRDPGRLSHHLVGAALDALDHQVQQHVAVGEDDEPDTDEVFDDVSSEFLRVRDTTAPAAAV